MKTSSGTLLMGIGMIFLAVGFILFPIVTSATDALLDYTYSGYSQITASSFTGFPAIVGITPLLVLLGFISASVFAMYLGVKVAKGGMASSRISIGGLLLNALAVVFIAIALIILPVAMDGVAAALSHTALQTDSHTGRTTAVGVTTGNMTLTRTLFNNSVANVVSVTSNITETPVADNFSGTTLFVTALTANQTRTLTATYYYADDNASYTGVQPILRITPLLILISFLSASVLTGYFGLKKLSGA